ncbi:sterile alpha motif domain-containing 11 [Elysia marginata]|uniref:Sterile alpha motif domain-containing 11 n=1 Tax=Elysia marginata TaxID=1093978 RepID=A0AAV4H6T7_9GAST|nr:sterile alpha motif domain-containing 11 [Elysia marginata]
MSVPRPTGDSAQRDQPQPQQPPQATALGTTLHIPSSHAFIPLQQFSFTPTETLGLRNPSDDNNNKPVSVVTGHQAQLPVVSVVTAVPGLCPPALSVHSMQQAVVGGATTIIPTVMAPMTVHAAAAAAAGLPTPTTTMTMTNTLNIGNHLSVAAAAASTAAQQQYQALGNTAAGLNLMTTPNLNNPTAAALNLANPAAVASAINNLNSSILANTANAAATHNSNNTSPSNHSSPSTPADNKATSKNSSSSNNSSNSNSSSNSSPASNNNAKPSINNGTNNSTTSSKSGNSSKNTSSSSSSSSSSQQGTTGSSTDTPDDLVKPVFKDGELVLEVECGQNKGILYLSKLCQGSKGPCISFQTSWLTPNEFQFVSGRETAKDWKRSIRHHGKSLKLLLAKGILNVHPTMCDCDGCRQGATLSASVLARLARPARVSQGPSKDRRAVRQSALFREPKHLSALPGGLLLALQTLG